MKRADLNRRRISQPRYPGSLGCLGAAILATWIALSACGATVSGPITNAVTWSGTVQLSGDVTLTPTGVLTIQPGTVVTAAAGGDDTNSGTDNSHIELIVSGGTLLVNGSSNNLVTFTSGATAKKPGDWYGIRVVAGDMTLTNCIVEYAVDGIRFEAQNSPFDFGAYALGNVTVQRCSGKGVYTTSGQYVQPVVFNNFQLFTNQTGLYASGPVTMVGGQVVGNTGDGVYLYPASYAYRPNLQMTGSTLARNGGWGLRSDVNGNWTLGATSVELENNVVQSNLSGGLTFYNVTALGMVSNNVSFNYGDGVSFYSSGVSAPGITGNVILKNAGVGVRVGGSSSAALNISGNDIYQNTDYELRNDSTTSIIATNDYWGEPTTTEVNQGKANLSRIYDSHDNSSVGQVSVQSIRLAPQQSPPQFIQQPQSVAVVAGGVASFSVVVVGVGPLTYQWSVNNAAISGATNATLVLTNVQSANAGGYLVIVSNPTGSVTSAPPAMLTITNTTLLHPADVSPADGYLRIGEVVAYASAWKQGQTWSVPPNPIPISYMVRGGSLWKGGEKYTYDPTVATAPQWWVNVAAGPQLARLPGGQPSSQRGGRALSTLPAQYAPGVGFTVAIMVSPDAIASAYAVEDQPPAGWAVANIDNDGVFDPVNRKVKWGLFTDNRTRTLTYQLTPFGGATGTFTFTGTANFDGTTDVAIGGRREITAAGPVLISTNAKLIGSTFSVSVSTQAGQNYVFEYKNFLSDPAWTPVRTVRGTGGAVTLTDTAATAGSRFYRVRVE